MSKLDPARGVDEIDAELRARASPERAAQERAYLKSDLDHLGVSVPAVRAVAMGIAARRPALGREDLLALVQALCRPDGKDLGPEATVESAARGWVTGHP